MLPRFNISRTAFLLCDIQEKLLPTIQEAGKVVQVAKKMVMLLVWVAGKLVTLV
jgi:hypothetical protein